MKATPVSARTSDGRSRSPVSGERMVGLLLTGSAPAVVADQLVIATTAGAERVVGAAGSG
jgi:hypothetical protein